MGSIEYILTNIAGIDKETLELLRGNRPGGLLDPGNWTKNLFVENNLGKNTMKLIDAVLKLDGLSTKNLGSSELTDDQKGSIDGLFGLSSKSEETPK